MIHMLRDCLCHPKYIVMYYKEKGYKIFLLILLFLAAFVGAIALKEYSTDYFLNADNEEIIEAIVVGSDTDIKFDAESNTISGTPVAFSSANYNVCFLDQSLLTNSGLDTKVSLIFTETKLQINYATMNVSEYEYTDDTLKSFDLEKLSRGSVADMIEFKRLLTKSLDAANFTFSTLAIVDHTTTVVIYYLGLVVMLFFFSFLTNPTIGKGVRFKLVCLDSIIFLFLMILDVMFSASWLMYIALMIPVFYSNITFRHIARKV